MPPKKKVVINKETNDILEKHFGGEISLIKISKLTKLFDEGINAVITPQKVIPSKYMDPKIKNRSRLYYLMANIEASQFKGKNNWALMLDEDGFVAEGSGNNFLIIKDGTVISPEGRNMLRGISRSYVMETLCKKMKIPVIEKNIEPYDVYNADEAFMTGTPKKAYSKPIVP